ncbi:MAG TPA: pyridoxamine 5'-phosphate oxidase family protein [Solirubrobacteraceae bacterium]|jgi:hypothetical protein
MADPDVLPRWPPGTVAVLATAGGPAHAIPVSTALRAGDRRVLIALAPRRESLARLRADPRCALALLAAGDIAITAHARAEILDADLGTVVAVALHVERIQDHGTKRFEIEAGVRWRWTDPAAEARDAEVRAALAALSPPAA